MLPQDPVILLSYINTSLRDTYASLDELCAALSEDREGICRKLGEIDYEYDAEQNQFI